MSGRQFFPAGRESVWIPPFGFRPRDQVVIYRMFPRMAWAFVDFTVRHGAAPVRIDFDRGGLWYGTKVTLRTVADPVLVGEIAHMWPLPALAGCAVVGLPESAVEFCWPCACDEHEAPAIIAQLFRAGRSFTFFRAGAVTWLKVFPCLRSCAAGNGVAGS